MRLYARIALLLGGFLLTAALIYGVTSYEWIGFVELLVAGAGFTYVGLYARRRVRAAGRIARDAGTEPGGPPSPALTPAEPGKVAAHPPAGPPPIEEVRPTIWPLVFSLAGAGIVAGVLTSHWVLLVGGVLAVAAAAGWFREVLAQRQEHH